MAFNYYTIIIGFLLGVLLFFRLPRLKRVKNKDDKVLKISVIIPARNEEKNLPGLLADLKNQTYKLLEVICVDDDSQDDTANIIKEAGAVYIKPDKLPKGWKGKTWACQNGAKAAKGEILLFIDADVRLSTTAVESLAAEYISNKKPISVQPYHTVKKQHEYFSLFFNLIEVCATGVSFIGAKKMRGLYGPLIMISKQIFSEYGGYETVKDNVAEDLNLGRVYSKKGLDVNLTLGADEVRFRMYPNSFKEVFEGWSKNFSRGSVSIRWWMLLIVFGWITFLTALPFDIAKTLMSADYIMLAVVGGLYLLSVIIIYRTAHTIGSYPLYVCILYPVYLLIFHVIFFCSIIATFIIKKTTWKGRKL